MSFLSGLFGLVGNGLGIFKDHLEDKRIRKRLVAQSERKVIEAKTQAIIDRAATAQAADIDWELTSINQSGWKDEFWTIVLAVPFILGFIPGLSAYVAPGFQAFASAPVWYQNILLVVICAPFGVRVAGRGADVIKNAVIKKR